MGFGENMFQKAPYEEHPSRCQAVNAQGQCYNLGIELAEGEYGKFCLAHGGNGAREAKKKESLRNYHLTIARWKGKLDEKADARGIKSLRDEVAILRICLEERLNKCHDEMDLILQSQPISAMVMNIKSTVESCHKLEGSMGHLLDKQAVLQFAQVVIAIVTGCVSDPEIVDKIANEILQTVGRIGAGE